MSVASYRAAYPEAHLQDPSIIMTGENNPFFGCTHTKEMITFFRESQAGTKKPLGWGANISKKHNEPNSKYRQVIATREFRQALSDGVREWHREMSLDDKIARVEKQRATNEQTGYWLPLEERDPFEMYRIKVRDLTEINYRANFYNIPNAARRGTKFGTALDHMLSIHDAYRQDVPIEVVAHYKNLIVIDAHDNLKKSRKSTKTYEQLLEDIRNAG